MRKKQSTAKIRGKSNLTLSNTEEKCSKAKIRGKSYLSLSNTEEKCSSAKNLGNSDLPLNSEKLVPKNRISVALNTKSKEGSAYIDLSYFMFILVAPLSAEMATLLTCESHVLDLISFFNTVHFLSISELDLSKLWSLKGYFKDFL